MTIILAMICGISLGYVLERGDFCFHSTMRGLFREPAELDLARAYLLSLLVAIPLVQLLVAAGWVDPWVPPFNWSANLLGGLIFGVGMVVAATCVTGLFYKLGHGMLGTLVGMAAWAVGDIITYRGPLQGLRSRLTAGPVQVEGQAATLPNLLPGWGWLLLVLLGTAAVFYLWRSPRRPRSPLWDWLSLGLAAGLVTGLAWLLAEVGGSDYTFGTSRVPTGLLEFALGEGEGGTLWIPIALISLVVGSFAAAWRSGTLWVRGENSGRYLQLAGGGLLMGVGAGLAGGCNLGHSLVGVPLLSLGSITSTLAMAAGVFLAHQFVLRLRHRNEAQQGDASRSH